MPQSSTRGRSCVKHGPALSLWQALAELAAPDGHQGERTPPRCQHRAPPALTVSALWLLPASSRSSQERRRSCVQDPHGAMWGLKLTRPQGRAAFHGEGQVQRSPQG